MGDTWHDAWHPPRESFGPHGRLSQAMVVEVKKHDLPKKFRARVVCIGHFACKFWRPVRHFRLDVWLVWIRLLLHLLWRGLWACQCVLKESEGNQSYINFAHCNMISRAFQLEKPFISKPERTRQLQGISTSPKRTQAFAPNMSRQFLCAVPRSPSGGRSATEGWHRRCALQQTWTSIMAGRLLSSPNTFRFHVDRGCCTTGECSHS